MSLIVEDGSIVANADSYVTLVEVRAYAEARGLTFPADDAEAEALVRRATDYAESMDYAGVRVSAEQALSWPRAGVVVHGFEVAEDSIPAPLKKAICALAVDVQTVAPHTPSDGRVVIVDTLGPISTTYKDQGGVARPTYPAFHAAIQPLLRNIAIQVFRA